MKIILRTLKDEILLKNCRSYLELDKILSYFASKEEIVARLNYNDDEAKILVLDNNGNEIPYSSDIIRATLSFYEQEKGEEFINWIYESSSKGENSGYNSGRIHYFFLGRLRDFNMVEGENNVKNPEGERLHSIINKLIDKLDYYDNSAGNLRVYKDKILPLLNEYVKRNGRYDYNYMRKFASALYFIYDYEFDKPKIEIREQREDEKDRIVNNFETAIHNYFYPQRQVRFEDIMDEPIQEELSEPVYDENGIKNEEKEFLEEFIEQEKAKKNIKRY